jgi:hypothetical protein
VAHLKDAGIPAVTLRTASGESAAAEPTAVRVGTMHSFKGLEFRCVAVIGVTEEALPFPKAVTPPEVDPKQHETDPMSERCLLFVARTRARDSLYVSWPGEPSPYLAEAGVTGGDHPEVHLRELTEAQLRQSLDGYVEEKSIARRGATRYVKDLAEALFANVTVLVEGVTDEGILLAFAERQGLNLGAEGICVMNAEGKGNMILCHAILTGFGVHCYLVFDADTGPKNQSGPANESQENREKRDTRLRESGGKNKRIFDYLRVLTAAIPSTVSETSYTVFADDFETYLKSDWPAWTARCQELVKQGGGYVQGKHVPTYAEAARTANGEPKVLHSLLENATALARQPMPRP